MYLQDRAQRLWDIDSLACGPQRYQHALARIVFAKVGLDHGPLDQLAKLLDADVAETRAQKARFI